MLIARCHCDSEKRLNIRTTLCDFKVLTLGMISQESESRNERVKSWRKKHI